MLRLCQSDSQCFLASLHWVSSSLCFISTELKNRETKYIDQDVLVKEMEYGGLHNLVQSFLQCVCKSGRSETLIASYGWNEWRSVSLLISSMWWLSQLVSAHRLLQQGLHRNGKSTCQSRVFSASSGERLRWGLAQLSSHQMCGCSSVCTTQTHSF